jgi:hypothetical protein
MKKEFWQGVGCTSLGILVLIIIFGNSSASLSNIWVYTFICLIPAIILGLAPLLYAIKAYYQWGIAGSILVFVISFIGGALSLFFVRNYAPFLILALIVDAVLTIRHHKI